MVVNVSVLSVLAAEEERVEMSKKKEERRKRSEEKRATGSRTTFTLTGTQFKNRVATLFSCG